MVNRVLKRCKLATVSIENRPKIQTTELKNGQSRVSLKDPILLCRIQTPVRGANCRHLQCFDLHSFLTFAHKTGNWRCPVCTQTLKWEDLVIDVFMKSILDAVSDDVDQVRLFTNANQELKAMALEGVFLFGMFAYCLQYTG